MVTMTIVIMIMIDIMVAIMAIMIMILRFLCPEPCWVNMHTRAKCSSCPARIEHIRFSSGLPDVLEYRECDDWAKLKRRWWRSQRQSLREEREMRSLHARDLRATQALALATASQCLEDLVEDRLWRRERLNRKAQELETENWVSDVCRSLEPVREDPRRALSSSPPRAMERAMAMLPLMRGEK